MLDMVDGTNGQKRRSLQSIEKLYPWFRSNYIYRYRMRSATTYAEKLKQMNANVFTRFTEARRKHQPVHGRMIQRWAKQESQGLGLTEFGASSS